MWCGPRNISTALMRAWGNRSDTFVVDEPLYAHYLRETRLPHAMADEIIEHYEADWEKVAAWLTGPVPGENSIFYQKQMCHHMLPGIGRDWLGQVTNCFLIREPREMLTSLMKKLPNPTLADTALPQQLGLFNHVRELTGTVPPVMAADLQHRGSLYFCRPTLVTYTASREDLVNSATAVFSMIEKGGVKIEINQRYSLSDVVQAHTDLEAGKTSGSTIITP